MRKGWLVTLAVMAFVIGLATTVSATTFGPYASGSVWVQASGGGGGCTASLSSNAVYGVQSGDIVQIQISYDLHAPGWFDGADAFLWFDGQTQQHAGTGADQSGTLQIQTFVSPNGVYNYFDRAVAYDNGIGWCDKTVEKQLNTYA